MPVGKLLPGFYDDLSMTTITSILSAYEGVEPRRALGGIYALSGFDYQLRCCLAALVDSLVGETTALDECGRVFVEALSDIATKTDDDYLVCVQVKRTLTAKTLKDSAVLRDQGKFKLVASGGDMDLRWNDLPAAHIARPLIYALLQKAVFCSPASDPIPGVERNFTRTDRRSGRVCSLKLYGALS